jgi:hypothetical protein
VLAGTTAGLAAAGTVLALILGATGSSPAFAVVRNGDGTVTLTIKQLAGITGANTELAALGVRARAVPVVEGCTASSLVEGLVARGESVRARPPSSHGARGALQSVRIDPSKIPAGQTLVLAARADSHQDVTLLAEELVRGRVPACLGAALPPPTPTPIPGSCRVVHNTPVTGRHAPQPPSVASAVQLAGETSPSSTPAGKQGRSGRPGNRGARSIACRVPPPAAGHSGNSGSQRSTRK